MYKKVWKALYLARDTSCCAHAKSGTGTSKPECSLRNRCKVTSSDSSSVSVTSRHTISGSTSPTHTKDPGSMRRSTTTVSCSEPGDSVSSSVASDEFELMPLARRIARAEIPTRRACHATAGLCDVDASEPPPPLLPPLPSELPPLLVIVAPPLDDEASEAPDDESDAATMGLRWRVCKNSQCESSSHLTLRICDGESSPYRSVATLEYTSNSTSIGVERREILMVLYEVMLPIIPMRKKPFSFAACVDQTIVST